MNGLKKISAAKVIEGTLVVVIGAVILGLFSRYLKPRILPAPDRLTNTAPITSKKEPQQESTTEGSQRFSPIDPINSTQMPANPPRPKPLACSLFKIREGQVIQCPLEGLTFSLYRSNPRGLDVVALVVTAEGVTQRFPLPTPTNIPATSSEGEYSISLQSFDKVKGIAVILVSETMKTNK